MIINEIFYSIQGESTRAGLACTFIRLTGCDLRCVYCDTEYAFHEGVQMSPDEILQEVSKLGCRFVTITGGEPLLQEGVFGLITQLSDEGYDLQIETSGSVDISRVDSRARVILDIKTPGSGMLDRMDWRNLERLKAGDEVKFVLNGQVDYDWARTFLDEHSIPEMVPVLFSPAHGTLEPSELAEWIKKDAVTARLHLQLHKYIWDEERRGV